MNLSARHVGVKEAKYVYGKLLGFTPIYILLGLTSTFTTSALQYYLRY